MAQESIPAGVFYRDLLAADAPLTALIGNRISYDFAGASPTYPYVLVLYLSGTDRNTVGATGRAFTRPLFLVEAITADDNWLVAKSICDRIDAVLVNASGTPTGLTIMGVFREREMRRIEVTKEAVVLRHLGGEYRCFCYSS